MRILAILASAAMVVSLFLPWVTVPMGGGSLAPWDFIKDIEPTVDNLRSLLGELPIEGLVIALSYLLAALFLLLAILGFASRFLALAGGGLSCLIIAYGLYRAWSTAQGAVADLGLQIPGSDIADLAQQAAGMIRFGGWAWGGGAVVLFLCGLVGFGRRRY